MMRWSYLIPRMVILTLVWAFFAFAFDPLVRDAVIASGERIARTRIELNDVHSEFFPPALALRDVQVTNRFEPGTNLVEFDSLTLQLAGRPLLRKSFVIERGSVTGLRWKTPRRDSGEVGPADDWLKPNFEKAGDLSDIAFEQLRLLARRELDPQNFETVRRAEELEDEWRRRFDRFEQRSRDVKARIERIRQTAEAAKGNTFDRIQTYQRAAARVDELLREVQAIREELPGLGRIAQSDLNSLDEARRRDLQSIEQKLRIVQLDADAVTEWLVGRELADRLAEVVAWSQWVRERMTAADEFQDPERLRGTEIYFPNRNSWPKYLLKTLDISGEAEFGGEVFRFTGQVRDVTTEPQIYGKPAIIRFDGRGHDAEWTLQMVVDRTDEVPVDEFALAYRTAAPWKTLLGDPDRFAVALEAGQSLWEGHLRRVGDQLDGRLVLRQDPVSVVPARQSGTDDRVAAAMADVLATVNHLNAELAVSGSGDRLHWTIESNLGPELAAGLTRVVSHELERQRQNLTQQLDRLTREQTADLKRLLNERYSALLTHLDGNENHARALVEQFAGGGLPLRNLPEILRR